MNLKLKKLQQPLLLMVLVCVMAVPAYTQTEARDTVNVRDKHNLRQAMYESNQEAFKPPRKNNWSVGVQIGPSMLAGDIRSERGLAGALNVRAALGHLVSLRGQLATGFSRGLNWRPNGGFRFNSGLNGSNSDEADYFQSGAYQYVYYNYNMRFWDFNMQTVFQLGNISFYNKEPKIGLYAFIGAGAMLYETKIDALDENGQIYDYSNIPGQANSQDPAIRKDVLNSLRNLLDGEYETQAEMHRHKPQLFDRTIVPVAHIGFGIDFKMSRRVSFSIEHRATWSGDDLMDGHRWEETNTLTANSDYLQMTTVGLNFRLGKGEESFWWQNPLTTLHNDVRDLKRFNYKGYKDSDNDGIPDNRDKEPNTPEGVLVDAQGRAIDSDGDGVQDFRDKEPFSPKGANVDRSGVALDSDDDGVIDFYDKEPNSPSGAQADAKGKTIQAGSIQEKADPVLPMINFELGKTNVRQEFYKDLYRVARFMREKPDIKIKVIGNADVRGRSTHNEELSKARAHEVARLLVEVFQVPKERLIEDFKGASSLLVQNLPGVYNKNNEPLHYLNRRVEFEIVK